MLDLSRSYYGAITADARRILLRAIIDISDPDLVFGTVDSQSAAPFSQPEQSTTKCFHCHLLMRP